MSTATTPTQPPRPKHRLSPRARARRLRIAQYVLLALVALALVLTVDWHAIGQAFFRADQIEAALPGLPKAMLNTLIYTVGAFAFGIVVGTILALMRLSPVAPYRWLATAYVEFFRGLPALIVLMAFALVSLAIPGMQIPGGEIGTVWIGLGIVSSAYLSETIRAGILAVPKGQIEAARSLGMSAGQATRKVVLPQAFRIILPPLANELILLVKDSSLVYVLGLAPAQFELTKYGRQMANAESNLTPLVAAAFCYLLITIPLTLLMKWLERRNAKVR